MSEVPSNLIPTRVTQLPYAPVASEESLLLIVYEGNTYQIMAGDLLQVAGVPTSRQVIAGTGMAGGGALSSNVTLSIAPGGVGSTQLANSGVTSGVYGSATEVPVFTVDVTGRVTAATTVPVTVSGYVPNSREVVAGEGLNGGGTLNNNVTLNANLSDSTPLAGNQTGAAGSSTDISRADHTHPAVDLSDDDEVDGILGLSNGGTAKSLVADAGAIIWSGADGLYVGPVGVSGQVLQATGASEYVWVDQSNLNVGRANNLSGGAANRLAVQTAPNTTGFVSAPTITDTFLKWNGSSLIWDAVAGAGTVTSVDVSGGTTGLTTSGGPITSAGTITLAGTLAVTNGGTGATTATDARTNLSAAKSGANSDITSLSGITGAISTVDSITFDTAAGITVGQGQMAWNVDDGTLNIGMGYDAVTQQVGLEQYFRIKASAAITNGQCVMFTGAVGASGVLTGAPATGVTNPQYIMGVATMDIANNGFGYITSFGIVRGIDTTGSSVGETWADGDILYYNPVYTGGLTKVEPIAPLPKAVVASVVNAGSGGSGSLFIRVQAEPNLQGLTDVYAPSPISNGQILIGDGPQSRWEAATLTAGTNISITNAAGAITINATDQYSGTVTSVAASGGTTGLTFSGSPITTSGTLTLGGTLAVANGGTGATSAATALTSLGAAASGANTDITSIALTTGTISTTPTSGTDIVNKTYADSIASGINFHQSVRLATTAALPANTYNNGSSGVGATLTANANGALSIDGVAVVVGNRVLIKDEVAGANNGVYTVTQVGDGSTPYILTRATDFDSAGSGVDQIDAGDFFLVTAGSTQSNTSWVQQTPLPITVGTTALVFTQFGAPITYSAGTGLSLAGTVFSITNTGVTATTYGSASSVPVLAINAQGQVTSASSSSIAIAASQITSGILPIANGGTGTAYGVDGGTF